MNNKLRMKAISVALGATLMLQLGTTAFEGVSAASEDLTQYVNMSIGAISNNTSNTVYGPQRPNASVNPSPDTNPQNGCTGYLADGKIRGFSQIHVSGTGVGKYGQFLVSPQIGLATRLDGHDSDKTNESSTCAEYSVNLSRYDIDCAFTPAEHSTIYKFTYPKSDNANLLIDLAHNIAEVNATDVNFRIESDRKGQTIISGSGYYHGGQGPGFMPGGWGEGHSLYFYAVVDKTAKVTGVYDASGAKPGVNSMGPVNVSNRLGGMGAYMTFDTKADEEVLMKIGVSFKSVEQAKTWLGEEIPDWDYNAVKAETKRQWNEELGKIVIDGDISETDKQLFYTAVYHSHVMPRDRTGDIEAFGSFDMIDDHFALWDTWRTLYPLYTITNPDLVAKTVNSFISRAKINGGVRDSVLAGNEMIAQQGGDNADNVIAEAYLKGIEGIDWEKAYEVIKMDAEDYRLDWQGWNSFTPGDSYYKRTGWIPGNDSSVNVSTCSYQLEYAYNDYCAAQIAKAMGDQENYEKWLARSKSWQNIWNPNIVDNGYSGFIWPKSTDGSWISDSAMKAPTDYQGSWSRYFYEGSSWNYSFFVPHDVPALIEKMGGEDAFCDRLMLGMERGWVDFSNEPAFLAPYLFSYTSKPYLTTDCVTMLRTRFNLNGVPGNDDSGAMSSWYIFSSIGFFPNAGQNLYYFTSPRYPETTIHMDNGKSLKLIANNLSDTNRYIQSITINGQPYKSTMFTHDVITKGGEIVFEMGSTPVNYAEKTTADVASVTEVSGDAVNLDSDKYDEWAHFTAPDKIDRKAGVANPAIAKEGLVIAGGSLKAGTLDGAAPGFSWTNGAPTTAVAHNRAYVWNGEGIDIPIQVPGGDARAELYVTGMKGRAVLEVYDSEAQKLTETEIYPNTGTRQFKKILMNFSCGSPETFTARLLIDPNDRNTGCQVGIAAVTLELLEPCTVSFDLMGGGALPRQSLYKGDRVAEPEAIERNGYVFNGWYADDALTIPWDFENDTVQSSLTLYAKWTMREGAFIESIAIPSGNTVVNLSDYEDWVHFGNETQGTIHYDRKNIPENKRAFGAFSNIDGQRQENELNKDQPVAFTWSDGTPTRSMTEPNRYFSWTRNGLELPITVPAGVYQSDLYLSGIRSRGTIEILNEDGSTAVEVRELWMNTGEDRQFRTVSVNFNNHETRNYIIRLLVDRSDTEPENYSMAILAATMGRSVYNVTARSGANGKVGVRGGNAQKAGRLVTVTAQPDPGYQFAGWEVIDGGITLDMPLQNPITFTMPSDNVILKADFTEHVVSLKASEAVPRTAGITLSEPDCMDWAYMGRSSGLIRKAGVENSVFTSNITADREELRYEDMHTTTPDSPYFNWTGGAPVENGSDVRDIVWNVSGMKFNLAFQPGRYETELYLSGIRAGVILEVLDANGEKLLEQKLWDNMGDYRVYRKLTLQFACDTIKEFTVHLRTDPSDRSDYWPSVALYAATVTEASDHVHDYENRWKADESAHWRECACGDRTDVAVHTFEWVEADDRYEACTVCGFRRDEGLIPGDMDKDKVVTIQDVMEACKVLARKSAGKEPTEDEMKRGNLDGDQAFTINDVMEICKILARKA